MKLDKNKIYSLEELTSEELKELWIYLTKVDKDWADCPFEEMIRHQKKYMLFFSAYNWSWRDSIEPTANAKELFYTLENVQVDCMDLNEQCINNMRKVFKKYGCKLGGFEISGNIKYLLIEDNICFSGKSRKNKTTITYEKFMELFSPQYEVTMIAEQPKEHIEHNLEMIDKPIQYQIGIDAIGIAEKNMTIDECLAIARFNITKYSYRKKNQDLEDFKKVIAYANWAISLLNKA